MECICKEYYSVRVKNDILLFVAKWMELEDIQLSEISQRQTNAVCSFSHLDAKNINVNIDVIFRYYLVIIRG